MPKTNIELPSQCRLYEGVSPEDIMITPFKGRHEKMFASITADTYEKKLSDILNDVVDGMDVRKMTMGDRLYILIWEAINSFSNEYPMDIQCQACSEVIVYIVDLNKLTVNQLNSDFSEPYSITLANGKKLDLRLIRVEDEIAAIDYEINNPDEGWSYKYARSIATEDNILSRIQIFEDLDAVDSARVRAVQDKYMHGPVLQTDFVCDKCGHGGPVPFTFQPDMVFPIGKALSDHFGKLV